MRFGLIFLPLSLCGVPVLAQASPAQPKALQLPPDTADRVTDAMQSISKAVHDFGDRGDGARDRDIQKRIAEAKPQIEQGIKAVNEALPEITASLQRAQQAVERAIANMPDPNYPKR